jgi:hypothetical protein
MTQTCLLIVEIGPLSIIFQGVFKNFLKQFKANL